MAKSPYPKCSVDGCRRRAKRWDGGYYNYVTEGRTIRPGNIGWRCTTHDPNHKSFDLPDTLEGAIRDIVILRERLQEEFHRAFKAEEKLGRWAPRELK